VKTGTGMEWVRVRTRKYRTWVRAALGVALCWPALAPRIGAQFVGSSGAVGSGEPRTAQADTGKYELSGTVVNSVTGDKIARVLVQMNGMRQSPVLTDADGNFHFEGLSRSSVNVVVRKPGYFSEQEIALHSTASRPFMVDIGPDTQPLTLRLVPAAIVTGRLTGFDNEPVEDAPVRLFTKGVLNGRYQWQQIGAATSSDDGHYRIGNLRPGQYVISVGTPPRIGLASLIESRPRGYPLEWFYPGVPDRSAATAVDLAPGREFQADIILPEQPVFRIVGTVVRPPDVARTGVQLMSADGEILGVLSQFRQNGQFEMRQVPAGRYILQANSADQQGQQYYGQIPISVRSNVNGIVLVLGPVPTIPVVLKTEFKKPQPEMMQFVGRQAPIIQIQLQSTDPPYGVTYAQPAGPDNPDLLIRYAKPGRYTVEFPQNYGNYAQSATCGNVDLLRELLVVTSGGQMPPIMVTLRDDGGSLAVNLNGTVPETGAQVLVLADDEPTQPPRLAPIFPPMFRQTSVLSGGRFGPNIAMTQMENLAPGNYTVLAFDRLDGVEYANPEVIQKYLPQAVRVTIQPNGKTSVNLDVIRLGE
jgi:Carboxypeptidase regulatory-like domain